MFSSAFLSLNCTFLVIWSSVERLSSPSPSQRELASGKNLNIQIMKLFIIKAMNFLIEKAMKLFTQSQQLLSIDTYKQQAYLLGVFDTF
ncbi:hypothetical protein V6Z12_D06G183800 [Gossypium hirsutum]